MSGERGAQLGSARAWLFWITVALAVCGGFFLSSTVFAVEMANNPGAEPVSGWAAVLDELKYWAGGMFLLVLGYRIRFPRALLGVLAWFLWLTGMATTLMVKLSPLGVTRYGATRWLDLQLIQFQPSELLKPAVVLLLLLVAFDSETYPRWTGPVLLLVSVVPVAIQPDLGGSLLILVFGAVALMLGGTDWKPVLGTCAVFAALVGGLLVFNPGQFDYVQERLRAWHSREEVARSSGYQVTEGLGAVAGGGWFGRGVLSGDHEFTDVPFVANDFILVAVAEQTGLAGVLLVIGLFGMFLWFATRLALLYPREPVSALVAGLAWLLVGQAALNMMSTLNLLPTTGVTLPFFSRGGSSLLVSSGIVALILSLTPVRSDGDGDD